MDSSGIRTQDFQQLHASGRRSNQLSHLLHQSYLLVYSYSNLEDADQHEKYGNLAQNDKIHRIRNLQNCFWIVVSYYPIIYAEMSKYKGLLFFDCSVGLQNVVYQVALLCQHKSLYTV